jgi:hypothetical protein
VTRPSKLAGEIVVTGTMRSVAGAMGHSGWNLVLCLSPWQRAGDDTVTAAELRVEIPASESEINRAMGRFRNGTMLHAMLERIDAPEARPRKPGWLPRGWVGHGRLPVLRAKGGGSLEAARKSLDQPVVITDARLGRLRLQRASNLFDGHLRFGGRRCELQIGRSGSGEDRARDLRDIARAGALTAKIERGLARTLEAVVRKYVPLYNDKWREKRPVLGAVAFRKRLKPAFVTVSPSGSATVLLEVGDLFADHVVEVRFNKRGTLSELALAG